MGDLHLNQAQKYFYFQSRIKASPSKKITSESVSIWESLLVALTELKAENGVDVFGLVLDGDQIHFIFSTPYFNENILVLDWEMRIKKNQQSHFDRPILCEPIANSESVKKLLIDIYSLHVEVHKTGIHWLSPFNSLKLLLEGSAQARLFRDPLKIIFQPSLLLQFQKSKKIALCVENHGKHPK